MSTHPVAHAPRLGSVCAVTIYLDLTREFNAGDLRAILSSGQAVVLHRLAVMSKDGDWILEESPAALPQVVSRALGVLPFDASEAPR